MGIIYLLGICLVPVSFIIIITFPVIMVIKSKKERDETNMHLFDEGSGEVEKKPSNSRWMGSAIIVAAIHLATSGLSLIFPIPAILLTIIISAVVLASRSHNHKKFVEEKKQKDNRYER